MADHLGRGVGGADLAGPMPPLLHVSIGIASETGRRSRNEDFLGACLGTAVQRAERGVVAAICDGIGGAPGGREAAEIAVRGFLEGYYETPETPGVRRTTSHLVDTLNGWIHAMGRADPHLEGMGCTFTGLVLRGRTAHVIHVGDTRLYCLSGERLTRLTVDHTLKGQDTSHILYRALGIEAIARLDYATHPISLHDRFLLCSDGVHGSLADDRIHALLLDRSAPKEQAGEIVAAALAAGSNDNASAMVIDVIDLPPIDHASLGHTILPLAVAELPAVGGVVDGFRLRDKLSDGRYSRVFLADDEEAGGRVVLKFPHPRVATEAACKAAFIREAWVAARVCSPWIGSVIALPAGRQTCLYTVMPYYQGETLEQRLARKPRLTVEEGRGIATKLGKAVATLHRAGMIHRDIKPENVILEPNGGLKLVDLGVVRVCGLEEFPAEDIPGTPSYMAPELFNGDSGSEMSDLFALGVTIFRAFTGAYPYGEVEPFSRPRFGRPVALNDVRPDLPAWLESAVTRAIAANPADRFGDVLEFTLEIENGPTDARRNIRRKSSLYDRNPLLFWQILSAVLAVVLLVRLIPR